MKLTVFQSDKGDCILVSSADGQHRLLADGGMRTSFRAHAAPKLSQLYRAQQPLEVVYVSHIDQDHISGVLQLLDDLLEWRVHEYQLQHGNPRRAAPDFPRPPEIKKIWHNAFHESVGKNSGAIADMLAAKAGIFAGVDIPKSLRDAVEEHANLATSIQEAIGVSRRIRPEQLNIALNPEYGKRLMLVLEPAPDIRLGSVRIRVIGPFDEDLKKLRTEWNEWLGKNQKALADIERRAGRDAERLTASEVSGLIDPLVASALGLRAFEAEQLALAARQLGRRQKVTTPNLASLMLLLEENGKTVVLTGDGHWQDILAGLEQAGALDASGQAHFNVLKVQHHGSEHNIHQDFCDAVTADHYIFCGNGAHQNPDLEVLELIAGRRFQGDSKAFRFWFNSSSAVSEEPPNAAHMKKVEKLAAKLVTQSEGRLKTKFLDDSFFELSV
jgi:beta-lactamase superfamily II metal-dependent hydrolase